MICGVAALGGGQALAADAPAPAGNSEIVVTGSRIPTQNLSSSSPLTVVSSQEAKLQGTTTVETLINNLPQAFADYTETASNGATGTATVNLRHLGNQRTLVLVDGTRLMPADPATPVADLNQVPAALVDHVEVVTGGQSAVYGSDALAGVVNFIMKKNFEGVRIDAQWGENWHGNNNSIAHSLLIPRGINGNAAAAVTAPPDTVWTGRTWDVNAIIGVNTPDGKGNATLYAGYRNIQGVTQNKYDYSACTSINGAFVSGDNNDIFCSGSSNYNRIQVLAAPKGQPQFGVVGNYFPLPGHTFRPRVGSDVFNFAPYNYQQRPDERYSAGGFAHYEIMPQIDAYMNVMFSDDHTLAQIAPSGLFGGSGLFSGAVHVNCDNPLLGTLQPKLCAGRGPTDDATNLFIYRRDLEGGPRIDDLRHTAYRVVLGVKGDLGDGWSYDLYGQYGTTIYNENYQNEFSKVRVQNALEVVNVNGVPTCKVVVLNIDPTCKPLDIFNGLGNLNADGLKYVLAQGFKSGATRESVVSGAFTGDLGHYGVKSPYAGEGVGVSVGGEYRRESLFLLTSRDFQTNDLYGQGGATLPVPNSSFNVKEGFAEVRIPIVEDMPYFKSLVADVAARYSDYSSAGSTWTYAAKLDWAPISDFRVRGSYQRAVRAPTVLEAFAPNNNVLFGGQDPCSGATPKASLQVCEAEGVQPGQYGSITPCPSAQCKHIVGGNAALKPEKSDTYSVGLVLTPHFIRGFTATVDWFSIKINDAIANYGATVILQECQNTLDPFWCGKVHRDANGFLFSDASWVFDTQFNTGFIKTRGVDVGAQYRANLADWHLGDHGSLLFDFSGTWTDTLQFQPIPASVAGGGAFYDCAGLYGVTCGTPTPKWRHRFRLTWNSPWKFALSVNWRYTGPVKLDFNHDNNGGNPLLDNGNFDGFDNKIKAYNWFDLAGTWTVKDGITLRAGMNNIFDKDPPIVDSNGFGVSAPPFGNGNTFPGVYDALGRTIFVGLTADF
jgi:outer membrane receptor protein involved in Fe transport